ncbi:transcription antitermination factor NusB [Candidatus Similichlamydia laticola]|uniref:NusB/RsmB/TIM44 domain-containing protein n=1 Tax=Candidatus Similichlamydia laticola TaxID=2170265 RepID=A0A369KDY8_9BACT|nr:transcription antitermination factor NusB [Candidatus Similichlamydia laticola]RDB31670.1 hypothetical protein HAT2_00178 [Candidatus Similichlamydia laticola]
MPASFAQRREALFLLVHAAVWGPQDEKYLVDLIAEQLRIPVRDVRDNVETACRLAQKIDEIDGMIRSSSLSRWESIGYTEKTILRIILFEKLYGNSLVDPILLSEASRLAKKFTGQQSAAFIHGILFRLFESIEKKEGEPAADASES